MRVQSLVAEGQVRLLNIDRLFLLAVLLAILVLNLAAPFAAKADTPLSRGYNTDTKLAMGSMVCLGDNSTDTIVPATNSNVDNLLGVVISDENSLLTVKNGKEDQVQVATSGTLEVLVSDINGLVKRGDHITASPIAGVGMKATGNVRIIGVAQSDADPNGVKQAYTDEKGAEKSVLLGQVPVIVNVAYYFKEPDKTIIPSAIQNLANAAAGKVVSTLPILISLAIFVVMLIIVASIIYSMIRGSIISVGRNPMSQSAVYRNLIQLSALVLVILGVGFTAMYLVLTRVG
jgi:hypothetical protein